MFFNRGKKDKDKDKAVVEPPVIARRPPVPPKRTILDTSATSSSSAAYSSIVADSTASYSSSLYSNDVISSPIANPRPSTFQLGSSTFDRPDVTSPSSNRSSLHSFGSPKDFDIQGLVLPALAPVQVKVRKLQLQKGLAGDFGFTIRRVQIPSGIGGESRTVVFAEPSEIHSGPPRPDDIKNGLLPGDELLEVDGRRVDSMSREELQETVRNAGQTIVLTVKAVPELAEFCDRRRGVRDNGDALMLTNVNTNLHEDIPESERYWLVHKGGYTVARLVEMMGDGRARVQVAGREMVVDSTDIDRANPGRMDRAADAGALSYINETSTVHLLRQRFGSNLLYTNAGSQSVICLCSAEGEPAAQDRLVHLFKGCRRGQMPAHIYATAQQVYRNLQMTGHSQSVVLTGASGSGKTSQLRNLSHYLATVAGWTKSLSYDKLALVLGVLETFGHCATRLHSNSTRFVNVFSLGFDKVAALRSARVQASLLEADRVLRRPDGDSSFHVFYYMWEGVDGELRQHLQLDSIQNPPIVPYQKTAEREKAKEGWSHLLSALSELGFCENRLSAVCSLLAAILHLHAAGSTPGTAQRAQFVRASHAQVAAELLGVTADQLSQAVFRGKTPNSQANLGAAISRLSLTSRGPDGPEALISFAAALYQELFVVVVEHINKAMATNSPVTWISILDYPGSSFHTEWVDGGRKSLGLNELVHNYVNERVAELFHDASFAEPQEVYSREQVDVQLDAPISRPHDLTRLLDQKQQLLTCTDIDRRSEERRGLLAILEEESMFPGASDDSLLERIFVHLGDDTRRLRRGNGARQLVLSHSMGSYPVTYDVEGWIKQAQPCETAAAARPLLANSTSPAIGSLFSLPPLPAGASKLRRATQTAQIELAARRAPSGFLAYINSQIDYVFSSIRRSPRSHFVHCVQPTAAMRTSSDIVDVPFVRSQLRSILLIDSVRANNRGYPERVAFRDFRRRFGCLSEEDAKSLDEALDDRAAVARILEKMDVHQHRFRLGISQILLASDVLNELEDRRELSLSGLVAAFQDECRRHLAAKWLQKRRVLETALRCIQKNGQSYMCVREWPWWRLYTRVVPLIAANKSTGDTSEWELRVRQLEQQLAESRASRTRAEDRVEELEETLARETQTAQEMNGEMEREKQTRVQLERRLQQWRDGSMNEDGVSRVSSTAQLESAEEKEKHASELRGELSKVRESEQQSRIKTQRAVAQLQDVEAELNKVRARNEILEKKQQRVDADVAVVEDQLTEVRQAKERLEKEKEEQQMAIQRKTAEIQSLKSESAELRATVSRLRREVDEQNEQTTAGSSEQTALAVQKAKRELELKIQAQEEELDDLAGQNQQLQLAVTRLEMGAERLKTDLARENTNRESEMDELRAQYQRRIRGMEDQLADAQDKQQSLMAENRMLEARARRNDVNTQNFELSGGHYRRELRKALALLADTQALLAHEREAAPSQAFIRQLREQVEDAEAAKTTALKGRHNLESELNDVRAMLEQTLVLKTQSDEKALALLRERNSGGALIEEKDEQLQALLKKYKAALQQNHIDHIAIADYIEQIADLEKAKAKLSDQLNELQSEMEFTRQHTVEKHRLMLAEQKMKDLEARVELEMAHKQRLESMVIKLTDEVDSLTEQTADANCSREKETEQGRRTKKEMMHLQETIEEMKKRELDAAARQKSSRSETDKLEEQVKMLQAELKLSNRRIEGLQAALSDGLGEDEDSDGEGGGGDLYDGMDSDMEREDTGTGMSIL